MILQWIAVLGGTSMRVINTAFRYYLTWHGEKSRGTEFKPCMDVVWWHWCVSVPQVREFGVANKKKKGWQGKVTKAHWKSALPDFPNPSTCTHEVVFNLIVALWAEQPIGGIVQHCVLSYLNSIQALRPKGWKGLTLIISLQRLILVPLLVCQRAGKVPFGSPLPTA